MTAEKCCVVSSALFGALAIVLSFFKSVIFSYKFLVTCILLI